MRTSKTYKVVMLPTEKASDLCLYTPQTHDVSNNILNYGNYNQRLYGLDKKPLYQHLYIISDEEIKEGDWFYNLATKEVLFASKDMLSWNMNATQEHKGWKKIVATTDKSLGEPRPHSQALAYIPTSFIEAYIKAYNEDKPITEVDLEMYEHIIGNQGSMAFPNFETELRIKTRPDNTVIVHQSKQFTYQNALDFATWYSGMDKEKVKKQLDKWIQDNLK